MQFYDDGRKGKDFEAGIRVGAPGDPGEPALPVPARGEPARRRGRARTTASPIVDLASRLSFFLWGTVPGRRAAEGRAATARCTRRRCSRSRCAGCSPIRAPRRCRRASRRSGCGCRTSTRFIPDCASVSRLRRHARARRCKRETELFFDSIVREDRSVLDLLTADYTFVNERLARHYGIPNVTGDAVPPRARCRRVPPRPARPGQHPDADLGRRPHLAGAARQVGDGSAARLAAAAAAAERAGARRHARPTDGGKMLTMRERMEEHRKNPACTSCHRVIDPLGLALENFDVTGAWRIKDNGVAGRRRRRALRRHADRRARRACARRC